MSSLLSSAIQVAVVRDGWDVALYVLTVVGVVISAGSLAVGAWEIRKIQKDLSRRAAIKVDFGVEGGVQDPWAVRPGQDVDFVLRVGLNNREGERSARHVVVNVEAPQSVRDFFWSDQQGAERTDIPSRQTKTGDFDLGAEAAPIPMMFLDRVIDYMDRRNSVVAYARVRLLGLQPPCEVPFVLNVDSDDLPDDLPNGIRQPLVLRFVDLNLTGSSQGHPSDEPKAGGD